MRLLTIIIALFLVQCGEKPTELRDFVTKGELYEEEIDHVKQFAETHGYNTTYCVLVDFGRHSGKYRIFVANMNSKTIVGNYQGLVAHGSGCGTVDGRPAGFSNLKGSNCSSEGIGRISFREYSNWGVKYKYWIEGLESSNSNMRNRIVVLHSWEGIPDSETYPRTIVESEGCFTVSNYFMGMLDGFIQRNKGQGDILLFAFQ